VNYLELQTAVLGRRFPPASELTNVKRWIGTAYQDVWDADDWDFKKVSFENLAVSGATVALPGNVAEVTGLYDNFGGKLERYSQEDFERFYSGNFAVSGSVSASPPPAYMVLAGSIKLSNSASGTYLLSYNRRVSHKLAAGTITLGLMVLDTSVPFWDDHHGLLVARAQAIGLQEINDPTYSGPQQEYERQLVRMKQDQITKQPAYQWASESW